MRTLNEILSTKVAREGVKTDLNRLVGDIDLNNYIDDMIANNSNNIFFDYCSDKYELFCEVYIDKEKENYLLEMGLIEPNGGTGNSFLAIFDKNLKRIMQDYNKCVWSAGDWEPIKQL